MIESARFTHAAPELGVVLGADVGASGCKVAASGLTGVAHRHGYAPCPLEQPALGLAEQDPQRRGRRWWH